MSRKTNFPGPTKPPEDNVSSASNTRVALELNQGAPLPQSQMPSIPTVSSTFHSCCSRLQLQESEKEGPPSPVFVTATTSITSCGTEEEDDTLEVSEKPLRKNNVCIVSLPIQQEPEIITVPYVASEHDVKDEDLGKWWQFWKSCNRRGKWMTTGDFLYAYASCTIGAGNLWRFPFLCSKYKGTFLIAFTCMFVVASLPLAFMEVLLGHTFKMGPVDIYRKITPHFRSLGWAMVWMAFITSITDCMVMAWSMSYILRSYLGSFLPWIHCTNTWNTKDCFGPLDNAHCLSENPGTIFYNRMCHNISDFCAEHDYDYYNLTHCSTSTDTFVPVENMVTRTSAAVEYFEFKVLDFRGTSWSNLGWIHWEVAGCMFVSWGILAFLLVMGMRFLSRAVLIVALVLSYMALSVILGFTTVFSGAKEGIMHLFDEVDDSKLMDRHLWRDAASQALYSMNTGVGCLMVLASYNSSRINCHMGTFMVGFLTLVTYFATALITFAAMGVITTAYETAFPIFNDPTFMLYTVFPEAFAVMPLPHVITGSFYVVVFTFSLSSELVLVETVVSTLVDHVPSWNRVYLVLSICFLASVLSLPFCLRGGLFIYKLMEIFASDWGILVMSALEVYVTAWVFGPSKMIKLIQDIGTRVPLALQIYWMASWTFLQPVTIVCLVVFGVILKSRDSSSITFQGKKFPQWTNVMGWIILVVIPFLIILIGTIKQMMTRGKQGRSRRQRPFRLTASTLNVPGSSRKPRSDNLADLITFQRVQQNNRI